jgi:RNA recognition motif-containing protein
VIFSLSGKVSPAFSADAVDVNETGCTMMKKLYVGNLPGSASEEDVRALFSTVGVVRYVRVIADRDTGQSRGFGFVDMASADADCAVSQLDGRELDGRTLPVSDAASRMHRAARGWR